MIDLRRSGVFFMCICKVFVWFGYNTPGWKADFRAQQREIVVMQPIGHGETRRLLHGIGKIVRCQLSGERAAVNV